jgi:outer membrane receptor protein involved in Fe transport
VYNYRRTNRLDTSGPLFGVQGSTLRQDASGTSFKANLSYRPGSNGLLYASFSQGFRLGTPQPGLLPGLCDGDNDGIVDGTSITIEQTRSVRSDRLNNYELGARFSFANRRVSVSAAVFRMDWNGLPELSFPPSSNTTCQGQTYLANAGAARAEGVELQATIQVTDAFRLDLGGSYIDSRLTRDAPALSPPAFEGDRTPGAPAFNANLSAQHGFSLGRVTGFVRADAIYVGPFHGDLAGTPNTRAGDYLKADATLRFSIANIDLDLFVRNITDSHAFSFRGVADYGPFYGYRLRPRTIGVQAQYHF